MGIISRRYIKDFVCRYDKEAGIPYYSPSDFDGLKQESFSFKNSKRIEIHSFYYYYDGFKDDVILLFCPGLGPGHTAYLAEIEQLAKRGYKVLTLDYTGCDSSEGECLGSMNMPILDTMDLLDYLKLDKPVIVIGHSLGGYTALSIANLRKDIHKAIIISGFLSLESLIGNSVKSKFIINRIMKYESKTVPQYSKIDNMSYLKNSEDKLLFIHSIDDPMVPYDISLKLVEPISNPNIEIIKVDNRKHNPNYTDDAVNYLNEVFGKYYDLVHKKMIKTDKDRINYFKDVSIEKLTGQDEKMFDEIDKFIKHPIK